MKLEVLVVAALCAVSAGAQEIVVTPPNALQLRLIEDRARGTLDVEIDAGPEGSQAAVIASASPVLVGIGGVGPGLLQPDAVWALGRANARTFVRRLPIRGLAFGAEVFLQGVVVTGRGLAVSTSVARYELCPGRCAAGNAWKGPPFAMNLVGINRLPPLPETFAVHASVVTPVGGWSLRHVLTLRQAGATDVYVLLVRPSGARETDRAVRHLLFADIGTVPPADVRLLAAIADEGAPQAELEFHDVTPDG